MAVDNATANHHCITLKQLPRSVNSFLNCLARWLVMVVVYARILTGGSEALAQNYCVNPPAGTGTGSFALNRTRTCANLPITVTNTLAGAQNISYNYQYSGNGLPTATLTPNTSFSYTTPGSYTILQVGTSSATGFAKCETVTIMSNTSVDFSVQACANRQATVTFQLTPATSQYDEFEVTWGDGVIQTYPMAVISAGAISHQYATTNSYQISIKGVYKDIPDCRAQESVRRVSPLAGSTTEPFIGRLSTLNDVSGSMFIQGPINTTFEVLHKQPDGTFKTLTDTQRDGSTYIFNLPTTTPQCFRVQSISGCVAPTSSQEYCTIVLDAKAVPGQNNVSWSPYTGSSPTVSWKLYRDRALLYLNANKDTKAYTDQNGIRCNMPYCYQLTAEVGPTLITSNPVCVTGISNNQPTSLSNVTVSVLGNGQVSVRTFDPNPTGGGTYTLIVTRSNGPAGPFVEVGQATNQTTFDDPSARTADQSYCYQLTLRNECGQLSTPSAPACTVHLSSKTPGALDWTADSPFGSRPVSEYEIVFIDRNSGVEIKRQSVGGNTHFEPDRNDPDLATYRYEIVAINASSQTSRSNPYELQIEAGIFAPNAFAPNGFNSRFQVKGDFTDNFRLTIFDRWGAVVYFTTSFKEEDGWDGNAGGQPAPTGTYAWRAEVRDKAGKQTVKASSVLLIR